MSVPSTLYFKIEMTVLKIKPYNQKNVFHVCFSDNINKNIIGNANMQEIANKNQDFEYKSFSAEMADSKPQVVEINKEALANVFESNEQLHAAKHNIETPVKPNVHLVESELEKPEQKYTPNVSVPRPDFH